MTPKRTTSAANSVAEATFQEDLAKIQATAAEAQSTSIKSKMNLSNVLGSPSSPPSTHTFVMMHQDRSSLDTLAKVASIMKQQLDSAGNRSTSTSSPAHAKGISAMRDSSLPGPAQTKIKDMRPQLSDFITKRSGSTTSEDTLSSPPSLSSSYVPDDESTAERTPPTHVLPHQPTIKEDTAEEAQTTEPTCLPRSGPVPEFSCSFEVNCELGQYTMDKARKVVSDYFGRNKNETKVIKNWLLACRKHYQRHSYQKSWYTLKPELIKRQVELIDAQQPGVRWKIGFVLDEQRRLTAAYQEAAGSEKLFDPTTDAAQTIDEDQPDNMPLAVLHRLRPYTGSHKTKQDAYTMIDEAKNMLINQQCLRLARFELVPEWREDLLEQWLEELRKNQKEENERKKKANAKKRQRDESSDTDDQPPRKIIKRKQRRAPAQIDNGEGPSTKRTRASAANKKGGVRKA